MNETTDEKHEYYMHAMEIKMNTSVATKLKTIHQLQLENNKFKQIINKIKAVSYTHLDVYKRQEHHFLTRSLPTQYDFIVNSAPKLSSPCLLYTSGLGLLVIG